MDTITASITATRYQSLSFYALPQVFQPAGEGHPPVDTVQFGGFTLTTEESISIIVERSMAKLRAVVDQARAELGIPQGAVIDTSPEATAQRIADFALGVFDRWRANHKDLADDDARAEFVAFIGAAIQQGIEEARGILSALQALTPEVEDKISTIWDLIRQHLDEFLANGE